MTPSVMRHIAAAITIGIIARVLAELTQRIGRPKTTAEPELELSDCRAKSVR